MLNKLNKKQYFIFGIIGIVSLLFFYAFMYSDILITTSFGINFWDILFKGEIFRFYEVCHSDINNAAYQIYNSPDYDFFIYIIFAIWNFPLWIVRKITHINIWESALSMMWAKSLVLLFTILTIKEIINICSTLEISEENKNHVVLIFITSPILYMSLFVNSQYDIIYLFFMLKAFDCYLKDNIWRFVAFMAITLPIKSLSIFLFPPLLLYKEKNVLKAALKTIVLFLPWIFFKIVFPMGESNNGNMENILVIFKQKLVFREFEIPLFLLAVLILYIACYALRAPEDENKVKNNSTIIAFLSYALFLMICPTNPYWYILLLPFQCILIGINEDKKYISTILETITSICYVGMYVWILPWCFEERLVKSTYISKIFGLRMNDTDNILDVLHKLLPSVYDMAEGRAVVYFFMLFLAGNIIFIVLNMRPFSNIALQGKSTPKYIYTIRYILGLGICMLPIIAYIV